MQQKKMRQSQSPATHFNKFNKETSKETPKESLEDKKQRWKNTEMKFGKYKGKKINDILIEDPEYLHYILNFNELNKGLKIIIKSLLNE